jgi:SNF2 family DNA or RNA helicase
MHITKMSFFNWSAVGRLLCDEMGMGKTVQGILILRRLLAGRGVKRVLILLPANLLQQWQEELRERGNLWVPRLDGTTVVWPDGRKEKKETLADALSLDILLMSRETARTEIAAPPWDGLGAVGRGSRRASCEPNRRGI